MKGLVFTTFYDFCDSKFGPDLLEDVIDAAGLPHSGGYTSVGTYPFDEMVALISALATRTGIGLPALLEQFGEFCFGCWVKKFPHLFTGRDLFDILASIDDFHESEVRKLYPDAELPSFTVTGRGADYLVLDYRSCKPLADLATGVIRGAGKHMNSPVHVRYDKQGDSIRFRIERENIQRLAA